MRTRRQLQVFKSKVPLPEIQHSFSKHACQALGSLQQTAANHAKGPALWELAFIHDLNTGLGTEDTDWVKDSKPVPLRSFQPSRGVWEAVWEGMLVHRDAEWELTTVSPNQGLSTSTLLKMGGSDSLLGGGGAVKGWILSPAQIHMLKS